MNWPFSVYLFPGTNSNERTLKKFSNELAIQSLPLPSESRPKWRERKKMGKKEEVREDIKQN